MGTNLKSLSDLFSDHELIPQFESLQSWTFQAFQSDDCISYILIDKTSAGGIIVDPKKEDEQAYLDFLKTESKTRIYAVIDTHTHADHISIGSKLSEAVKAPLIMHQKALSQKVHFRVCQQTSLIFGQEALTFLPTPGHTQDSICVFWGPFLFGGDTLLFGDIGRDDLPTGDVQAHYESVQKIKSLVEPDAIVLPGHDAKGGRASTWQKQLEVNPSLTQDHETFVKEAGSFVAPAPRLFKESLFENLK